MRILKHFFFVGVTFGLMSCGGAVSEGDASAEPVVITREIAAEHAVFNPNPSSELAVLMRHMNQMVLMSRDSLAKGVPTQFDLEIFEKMSTAVPSKPEMKDEAFFSYAAAMLASASTFNSEPESRLEAHNNLVQTCLACHQTHCPGPMKRIRKLHIPVEKPSSTENS